MGQRVSYAASSCVVMLGLVAHKEAVEATETGLLEDRSLRKRLPLLVGGGRKVEEGLREGVNVGVLEVAVALSPDSNIQAQSGQGAECIRKATSFRVEVNYFLVDSLSGRAV